MTIEERLDVANPRLKDFLYSKCGQCGTGTLKLKLSPAGLALDQLICTVCKYEVERIGIKT